jgi:hypothetical protein
MWIDFTAVDLNTLHVDETLTMAFMSKRVAALILIAFRFWFPFSYSLLIPATQCCHIEANNEFNAA